MLELTLDIHDLPISLSTWGPGDGDLVVCIHGFLDQGAAWEDVAHSLVERGYRVVAPDARGHGRSGHVGAGGYYHFTDYLVDLDGVLEQLSPTRSVALVGHSMGGTVVSMYAGARHDRVDALVLVEGLGPGKVSDDRAAQQLVAHLRQLRHPPEHGRLDDLDDAMARMRRYTPSMSPETARRLAERVTAEHRDPETGQVDGLVWTWDPLHRTRGAYAFDADRYQTLLRRIRCPVTLVVGESSPFSLNDLDERVACLQTSRQVVLPSGHNPHIECPGLLADEIDAAIGWARARRDGGR